ncbi:type II secretion system F family protein [Coralliovum pocilloporae]|uniref:type II secretion system F family protein n=1 Tax=Coralliovum pocilloporae TaxID=3066369 RepID=UPI003306A720
MDSPVLFAIALALLVMFSIGGVAYAILYPMLAREARKEKRMGRISSRADLSVGQREAARDRSRRRKSIEDTLKEAEEKQKAKNQAGKISLKAKIKQAGLSLEITHFWLASGASGLLAALVALVFAGSPLIALCGGLIGGCLPLWVITYIRKKRLAKFVLEFPNAIDVIVRGVKAGLPLGECIILISKEAPEPVRTEFKAVVEAQSIGASVSEAIQQLPKRIPVPEANFFAIAITIQQQAGGNLAEALSNLSTVLRSRKALRQKADAMSMEAKASGAIIGSMPPAVMFLVYITSPDYVTILFDTESGNLVLAFALGWMCVGIGVMKKMINFNI